MLHEIGDLSIDNMASIYNQYIKQLIAYQSDKWQEVWYVVSHEIAHQWYIVQVFSQ